MNNKKPKVLIVDNYDSFTYNLVQIIREYGKCDFNVEKNREITVPGAGKYDGILFSPGPGIPAEVPVMAEMLREYADKKSFLGVCLGHQAIAETFGMKLMKLEKVRHGAKSRIRILEPPDYLFEGIPSEFNAGLYHSWAVFPDDTLQFPCPDLRITSLDGEGIVMGVAHVRFNIRGVQFHPESYISEYGALVIQNWINHL